VIACHSQQAKWHYSDDLRATLHTPCCTSHVFSHTLGAPFLRTLQIVVADQKAKRDGKHLERVSRPLVPGWYAPVLLLLIGWLQAGWKQPTWGFTSATATHTTTPGSKPSVFSSVPSLVSAIVLKRR
jgi:ribosomal protein S16